MEKVRDLLFFLRLDSFIFLGWSMIFKNGSQRLLGFMWMSVPFASYLTCEVLCSEVHSVHDPSQVRVLSASYAGFI